MANKITLIGPSAAAATARLLLELEGAVVVDDNDFEITAIEAPPKLIDPAVVLKNDKDKRPYFRRFERGRRRGQ
jgi:hypothetical protein